MNDYNGLARSEWRLEVARVRAAKQKRLALLIVAAVVLLLAMLAWSSLRSSAKISPPRVTVEWPSPQKFGRRIFAPDTKERSGSPIELATLVVRKGQPFTVMVEQANTWNVRAVSTDTNESGPKATWAPSQNGKLKLYCRPKVGGWKRLFPWALPTYELHLDGIVPTALSDGRLQVSSVKPATSSSGRTVIWLASQVVTSTNTFEWDDRALPIAQTAPPTVSPAFTGGPRWKLFNSFGPNLSVRATGDTGTYLLSNDEGPLPEVVDTTTRVARYVAELEPRASIKFIVSERQPTKFSAVLRLDFDGTGTRFGWVKNAGEAAATPLRWWDNQLGTGLGSDALPPVLPRR
jgi:hypothetical protein